MTRLDRLEADSIYILREAYKNAQPLAMLWSIGKDSNVAIWLAPVIVCAGALLAWSGTRVCLKRYDHLVEEAL